MDDKFVIGVDFGTDSVRAIGVNAATGEIVGSETDDFRRWKEGLHCEPSNNQFRQHPLDHFEALERVLGKLLRTSQMPAAQVKALSIDTTGSSPVAVDRQGKPLACREAFKDNPNAMVILWKDHTAVEEAARINEWAKSWGGADYTTYSGGIYSSEWFWSKIFHVVKKDPALDRAAWTWMEHCDLITYELTGGKNPESFKRSRCAAGHKGMWHKSWGGYPSASFLEKLHPSLARIRKTLPGETYTSDQPAGALGKEWAEKLGLREDTIVSVGILDAHAGALGSGIRENVLVKVMGTSTCDMLVNRPGQPGEKVIPGISGQVDGSIIPHMIGFEAGQSAFGDVLAWFRNVVGYPLKMLKEADREVIEDNILQSLSEEARKLPVSEESALAVDWINGRRTPDANQRLTGAMSNLTIGMDAPWLFKGLVESICFGAKAIVDRFLEEELMIQEIVGVGGVADKSPLVMQTLADVLQHPIKVSAADQAGALGCAMFASVAAGLHPDTDRAVQVMGKGFKSVYQPDAGLAKTYQNKYQAYLRLGAFIEEELPNKSSL